MQFLVCDFRIRARFKGSVNRSGILSLGVTSFGVGYQIGWKRRWPLERFCGLRTTGFWMPV
jgi:hypothetical protein